MTTDVNVSVRRATAAERPLIEGLAQLYIYDFSEMEPAGSDDFQFDERGGFGPLPDADDYWRGEAAHALLIFAGDRVAGFALLNTHSYREAALDWNMGEFFVARQHWRGGVATQAVRRILALYPGRWEAAVVERNLAAKAFWPKAIAAAPNVSEIVRHEGDGALWTGPIWSFVAAEIGG